MKAPLKNAVTLLAAAFALAAAGGASAQSAGQLTAKIGAGKVTPREGSGAVSAPALPNSMVDVGSDTQTTVGLAYGLTDNISAELDFSSPFRHKLYGAGVISGTGQLGSFQMSLPSAFIQYRLFRPEAMLRPFVGVGVTYAHFQKETGSGQLTALLNTGGAATRFEIESKAAASVQAGVAVNLHPKWFVDLTVVKTFLEVDNTFSSGQTQKIRLDPITVGVAVGYKF